MTELAAVIGGHVLIVDADSTLTVDAMEAVPCPEKH